MTMVKLGLKGLSDFVIVQYVEYKGMMYSWWAEGEVIGHVDFMVKRHCSSAILGSDSPQSYGMLY